MSSNHFREEKQIKMVQCYLEREFPGQVRDMQWDGCSGMQVFEVIHDKTVHRVEMPATFFEDCPDYTAALRDSELADYMREAKAQARRFSVVWEGRSARVRSTPM